MVQSSLWRNAMKRIEIVTAILAAEMTRNGNCPMWRITRDEVEQAGAVADLILKEDAGRSVDKGWIGGHDEQCY